MKKWLLAVLLLSLLTGCGAQSAEPTDSVSDDLIVVGLSQLGAESDWRVANSESMRQIFTEKNGYQLIYEDAKQKQENQIAAVRNFIQQDVDYIVMMPIVEDGWDSVLLEAYEAKIPVVLVDRTVNVSDGRLYTTHIGSDFYKESQMAVEWLEQRLLQDGRENDGLNIVHIQGTPGASAQLGRTKGLEEAIAAHENWQLTAQENGDFTQPKTYEVMTQILAQMEPGAKIDVVYCENDNMAFGAIEALEERGYSVGGDDGVIVICFDATHTGLQYCLDGKIAYIVECNPLLGDLVDQTIRKLEKGEAVSKEQFIPEQGFARADLTQKLIDSRPY